MPTLLCPLSILLSPNLRLPPGPSPSSCPTDILPPWSSSSCQPCEPFGGFVLRCHLDMWSSQVPFTLVQALLFVFSFPLLLHTYITLVLSASDPTLPGPLTSPFPCPSSLPAPPLARPSHFPHACSRIILVHLSPHASHSFHLTLLTFTPPFPVLSCPPHVQPSPSHLTPALFLFPWRRGHGPIVPPLLVMQ
jgi:hypothetical protein